MEMFIFIVGFFVSMMVVYGIFSQVPGEMRPPEKVYYRVSKDDEISGPN